MYHKSHFTLFLYNIYCILQFFKVCLDKFGDSDKKKQDLITCVHSKFKYWGSRLSVIFASGKFTI